MPALVWTPQIEVLGNAKVITTAWAFQLSFALCICHKSNMVVVAAAIFVSVQYW